jgi:hypothetical protein
LTINPFGCIIDGEVLEMTGKDLEIGDHFIAKPSGEGTCSSVLIKTGEDLNTRPPAILFHIMWSGAEGRMPLLDEVFKIRL